MYEGSASIQYDYYCGLSQLMSCASAPSILGLNHLLEGKKASCYPGFEEDLLEAKVSYDPVSKDGNIITSRGMGTAIEFACELIAVLLDEETAKKMKETIIYQA